VRFTVINTFQPDLAGIEKAQLIQFEMDPGAEVKDFKLASSEILWVTKGVFTYKYGDKIVEKKAGESWLHQEGIVLDINNKSKGVAILRGIQFLKKK
jgi:quercetin dioxygenase-like cupin family protein